MTLPSNDSCETKSFSRLSNNVIPRHYKLTINPDLKQFTFTGNEVIDVSIKEPTNSIQLNCLDIEVKSASFENNGRVITAKEWKQCDETERVTIVFPSQLETGEGRLSIDYVGVINDKLKGFYRSKYTTSDGEVRYSATTKFEPTHARRAFPCWDEPAVKATFDIILICPKDRLALSNMNVVAEEAHSDTNLKVVKFATTPIMSTYLVAFIVGEYDYVEDTTDDGIKVRVYTPVDRKEQGNFSLEVAVKCLPFYKKFFDVAYPLPKMDLIAIADFASGAMENWGLVTFRETCLLFDSKNTSASRKQWIAIVVAHELAHQWFGNLVTMEWWTHLWLNEGFATFMEFLCVASLYPQYDLWMQYVTDCVTVALSLDGLHNSHPVEVPVSHPCEITEIFDMISYKKGSSILGMLHNYVGNEIFSKSLSLYLKKHSYKNTVTEDLWDAIEEVSKKPIGNVMNTWTKQKGYPVISVTSRQDGNNRILTLKQEKFCANGKLSDVDKEALWLVPITIITQANPEKDAKNFLFDSKTVEVVLENVASKDWVKLNRGCIGVYRVHYSQEMLEQFLPCIRDKSMPPLERLGLQNDLFAMVQEGRASTVDLLRLLEAYSDEDNYAVWDSLDSTLARLSSLLSHTDYQEHFHAIGRRLLSKIHAKLGWDAVENESHLDTMLRSLVLNRLIAFKEKSLLEEARRRFDAYVNGTYVIPADIRATVYRGAAANADDKTFDNFFALYRKADLHEEKNRIITSLAATNDPVKAQKVLDFSISEEVRTQDSVYVISAVSGSTVGRDLSWRFFQDNFKELSSRYDTGFMASHLVKCVTAGFASEDKALEIEQFFSKNPIPAAQRALQQSMESVRLKSEWLSRDTTAIKSYLIK